MCSGSLVRIFSHCLDPSRSNIILFSIFAVSKELRGLELDEEQCHGIHNQSKQKGNDWLSLTSFLSLKHILSVYLFFYAYES